MEILTKNALSPVGAAYVNKLAMNGHVDEILWLCL